MEITLARPKVGVGVLVVNDGKLLLGERIHAHGSGTWCPPGGHLEFGETPIDCARRELWEEAGLHAVDLHEGPWTNDIFAKEKKHYITIFITVMAFEGHPTIKEPNKCAQWSWFPLDKLPKPLFPSIINLRASGKFHECFP